ncbi:MAG TPA: outer membrane protein transport protein [Polyangia bacterium]|jgi:long-chain fatty acid transport protein
MLGRVVVLCGALASAATVWAGGFTIPIMGARMAGQAAFIADPDDATAVYHNPAGLALVPGLRIDAAASLIFTNTSFTRVDYPQVGRSGDFDTSRPPAGACPAEGAATGYDADGFVLSPCRRPAVGPKSGFGALPFAAVTYNPAWHGLSFGLGVYSPHNATAAFPRDGAQRYIVTEGAITTLYVSPAVAWQPHPALVVAGGPSIVRASARYERAIWLPPDLRRLNPGEIWANLDGSSWTAAWQAGLLFHPGELTPRLRGLSLGVSYVSRVPLDFGGQVQVMGASQQVGQTLQPGYAPGQTILRRATARLNLPDMLRAGVGYSFGRRAWIGADVYWSHYSLFDALTITLADPLGPIAEFKEEKHSTDSWSFAAGGRVTLRGQLDLRAGFFFDQSPYPDAYYTTLSPDATKLGESVGGSWRLGAGLELALAYMTLFYADRRITNSRERPEFGSLAPFSANGEVLGKIVHLLAVQIGWTR